MGNLPLVAVNDFQTAVDMFIKDGSNYEDRVPMFEEFMKTARQGNFGISNSCRFKYRFF